ncbi:MAG: molybdopterin-guanine dinucleotide biosynthesis protein B [Alphaproteobacteria bacterium]
MTAAMGSRSVIGVTGWSGSGKTSLVIRLIPEFRARGFRVATVKHAHHAFDIDTPGKDSYEHRAAGAVEVVVSSARRWAVMHENRDEPEPTLDALLARMSPADIVLVEGFKNDAHAKIEVHRPSTGAELICTGNESVIAVASDEELTGLSLPVLDLNDTAAIADFIAERCGLASPVAGAV